MAVDLYCGLGGWTQPLLDEGWDVIGFDNERHVYGDHRYPAQLVLQDVRTLHGSQFRNAGLIVASPPCQKYSYMAMPWTRAKDLAAWYRDPAYPERIRELNELFDTCFRIQREACEAAGRHIPLIVENVRGAQAWVGRARWNYGSFYLWGDVPALMPATGQAVKVASQDGGRRTDIGKGAPFTSRDCGVEGMKQGGDWFAEARKGGGGGTMASYGSKSPARKAASALIAKIPYDLARHIAVTFRPESRQAA